MPELDQLVRLQEAHHRRLLAIQKVTGDLVVKAWDTFGGLDDAAMAAFSGAATVVVEAAKVNVATLAVGYMNGNDRIEGFPARLVPVVPVIRGGVPTVEVYGRAVVTARVLIAKGRTFLDAMGAGRSRAESMARTDVVLTNRGAMAEGARSRPHVVGYRRTLTLPSCGLCATASTQRYKSADLLPIHSGCVIGSTVVAGDGLREVSRRWYSGEIVVVRTAAGHELSITPKHPVLTTRGWVPADDLREGMYLLSAELGDRERGSVPNERDVPASIEDRFRAGLMPSFVSVPFASENFHGDWGDGEVDVVTAYRHFGHGRFSKFTQPAGEFAFAATGFAGIELSGLCREHERFFVDGASFGSGVRGGSLSESFGGGHSLGAFEASFGSSTTGNTVGDQIVADRGPRNAEPGFETQLRLTSEVSLDCVTELRRVNFRDYVFNLHTGVGWYFANGIVVHNCDCGIAEIFGTGDPGHIVNRELLNELKKRGVVDDITRNRQQQRRYRSEFVVDENNVIRKGVIVDGKVEAGPRVKVRVVESELGPTLGP